MTFRKYIGDSKMFEYDKHYRMCRQQAKPFIKARTNPVHKNYFVQIDLITCNYDLSEPEQDLMHELIQKEAEYVKSNLKHDFRGFNISKEIAWFDGISSEHVDTFCNTLYDLTQKYHR